MAEVTGGGTSTPIINYQVSGREGKIYRSSKVEEPGYTRVEMQNGQITYHKYVNGLSGRLTYMAHDVKEIQGNDGKKLKLDNLKIFLNDGQNTQALSLKTYSTEWKLFIKNAFNADFSKSLVVGFYKGAPSENGKVYQQCSVSYEGEVNEDGKKVYPAWLNTDSTEKGGEVPPPVKNRKGEWDYTDNDLWYFDKMNELIERFKEFKNSGTIAPPPTTPNQQPASVASDGNGLPF
jgi:hypothetical protein